MENESEYRKKIQVIFDKIEMVFESIDPDLAECEQSLGALTVTFSDRSRCILSAQPSVRQLWLALAPRGTAYHFSWDSQQDKWFDDKGKGIELIQCLENFFKEMTEKTIKI